MSNLLEDYTKEIYGDKTICDVLTLEELIASHRHLRSLNHEAQSVKRKAVEEGYALGVRQGLAKASYEYIKIERLKEMTLAEIIELIDDADMY